MLSSGLDVDQVRMTQTHYIQGAGGGGKGVVAAIARLLRQMTPCNLYSLPTFLISLVKEIQGLDDGNKSIFLDDTAVQNSDGTNNFAGYTVVTRNAHRRRTISLDRSMLWSGNSSWVEVITATCHSQHFRHRC